jgi:hypothetical protein
MEIYVLLILALAFATEATVELLVKSEFFKHPRQVLSRWSWFKALINCGYCTSVWVAMGFIAATPASVLRLSDWAFVNVLITLLLVQRLSNIMHNVIDKWTDKYYDVRYVNTEKD